MSRSAGDLEKGQLVPVPTFAKAARAPGNVAKVYRLTGQAFSTAIFDETQVGVGIGLHEEDAKGFDLRFVDVRDLEGPCDLGQLCKPPDGVAGDGFHGFGGQRLAFQGEERGRTFDDLPVEQSRFPFYRGWPSQVPSGNLGPVSFKAGFAGDHSIWGRLPNPRKA